MGNPIRRTRPDPGLRAMSTGHLTIALSPELVAWLINRRDREHRRSISETIRAILLDAKDREEQGQR
jgi:hypothetical protein